MRMPRWEGAMQGYDAEDALRFVARTIGRKGFAELGPKVDGYLRQAQELDLRFMRKTGVLDAEGYEGDGEYDEDEAFEYIVEEIVRLRGLNDEEAVLAASLVNAYMAAQDAYLRKNGLARID